MAEASTLLASPMESTPLDIHSPSSHSVRVGYRILTPPSARGARPRTHAIAATTSQNVARWHIRLPGGSRSYWPPLDQCMQVSSSPQPEARPPDARSSADVTLSREACKTVVHRGAWWSPFRPADAKWLPACAFAYDCPEKLPGVRALTGKHRGGSGGSSAVSLDRVRSSPGASSSAWECALSGELALEGVVPHCGACSVPVRLEDRLDGR